MTSTPRVLFSCVGENRPDWHAKMENLVLSIRHFGGSLADAPVVVNVVGGAAAELRAAMERLGAEVRVVQAVDRRRPTSNKLRMFELAGDHDFDVLAAIDCDIVALGDLAPEVRPKTLRAVPAGRDILSDHTWQHLYRLLNVPLPAKSCTTVVSGQTTYPYFNSGVLLVPRSVCAPLHDHWARHLDWLLGAGLDDLGLDRLRKDQIPLSAALATAGLEVDPLPVNFNLSVTAARFAKPYRQQWGPPFLLHYHRLIGPDGFLLPSPNARINPHIDTFNRVRAEHLSVPYAGLSTVPLQRRVGVFLKDKPGYRWARGHLRRAVAAAAKR
ncbi:MAG TPA: hypothetical protein VK988_08990 [Acidimicrobiales bacterium]|nr:hypothetical protein [Acidimicrobiales bacterium]